MAPRIAPLVAALALLGCAAAREPLPAGPAASGCPRALALDEAAVTREAACRLREYIRIDTRNPGAGETAAADYLAAWLAAEGIASRRIESAPGRVNLVARLEGRHHDGALMLVHHMDVVPANAAEWSVPPLEGVERDGAVWGRGSLDDKGGGVIQVLAAVLMKRLGVRLEHDLVLLAVADEEAGGGKGARFLAARHRDALSGVEYALNEGGAIVETSPGHVAYSVEVSQKAPLWLRLTTHGTSGHAASPDPDSAVTRLVRALSRLDGFEFPVVVLPSVERQFAEKAGTLPEGLREGAGHLRSSMRRASFRKAFLADPHRASLVRNTFAVTMLEGSDKENVIPGEASAVVDLRLLPGQDPDAVTRELLRAMGDPSIEVTRLLSWPAVEGSADNALFRAIRAFAGQRDPGAPVLANVISGFTDCNAFRAAGLTCLGFTPIRIRPDDFAGVHGKDERVDEVALGRAVLAMEALADGVVGAASPAGGR